MHALSRVGIKIQTKDLFDTMLASWLCDENTPNGLKENSAEKLKIDQTHFKDVVDMIPKEVKKEFGLKSNSKATFDLALIDDAAPYALADAFNTWELYLGFSVLLEEVFGRSAKVGTTNEIGVRNNMYSTSVGLLKYYEDKLRGRGQNYSMFDEEEIKDMCTINKKISFGENSILGKLFGYFFDN